MLDDSRVEDVLKLLKPHIVANKCYFCQTELTEEEKKEPHGLCGDCFWLRRIVKRIRKDDTSKG